MHVGSGAKRRFDATAVLAARVKTRAKGALKDTRSIAILRILSRPRRLLMKEILTKGREKYHHRNQLSVSCTVKPMTPWLFFASIASVDRAPCGSIFYEEDLLGRILVSQF